MARNKRSKKQLLQFITQYGIHIWAILIIANAVLVYSYHFASHAAGKNDIPVNSFTISGSPTPSTQPSVSPSVQVSPSSGPSGPVIDLTFTVPGIGSGGGVMKPLHTKRNVTVYIYAQNVNSMDPTVNPLYTIQGTAMFDSNPESPTYTSFINPNFDLGSSVQNGNYQIAFRTDLSFTTLIKQNASDIGGEIFSVSTGSQTQLPSQQMLMGDSIPNGNNYSFTINDYNAFINCYGDKNATSSFCKGQNYADFNDDGVVDGIDYNILLRSLDGLLEEGEALPKITPTAALPKPTIRRKYFPTPIKTVKKINTASPAATSKSSENSGAGAAVGVIFFFFILIILGGGVFLYLKNERIHEIVNALIHLSPTGSPAEEEPTETETSEEQAGSSEQPIETETSTENPSENPPETQPETPPAPSGDSIEKDCYVKKKGPDDAGTGVWLLLTDDNGAVNAHYAKNDATDGFAKVKGVMKTDESGKKYLEISELSAEG